MGAIVSYRWPQAWRHENESIRTRSKNDSTVHVGELPVQKGIVMQPQIGRFALSATAIHIAGIVPPSPIIISRQRTQCKNRGVLGRAETHHVFHTSHVVQLLSKYDLPLPEMCTSR